MKLATILLSLAGFVFLALASPTSRAAGPSGQLTYPPGGTIFSLEPHGSMHLSYSQVSQANAQTLSIDVYLEALDDYNLDVPITYGLSVNSLTAPITGWWSSAGHVGCGFYRLKITEAQKYNGEIIVFQSAAPTIQIYCLP